MNRLLGLVFLAACAANPEIPKTAGTSAGDQAQVQTLLERANAQYAAASKLADVEGVMTAYEDVLKLAPDHKDALLGAAKMHYYHAADIVPIADREKRMASYLKGREYALRAMALNPKWREAYEKDADMIKHLALLGNEDGAAIYWAALNWAKWGELYGILRAAIDIPKVKAMMEHVNKVAPLYWGNGADRFFVGYWVAIPGFAGKDPKKSKAAYEKAVKESPTCLANQVTYAEYYAKDTEDRPLFDLMLKKTVETPDGPANDPMRLLNQLSKEEARGLMVRAKEIFE